MSKQNLTLLFFIFLLAFYIAFSMWPIVLLEGRTNEMTGYMIHLFLTMLAMWLGNRYLEKAEQREKSKDE